MKYNRKGIFNYKNGKIAEFLDLTWYQFCRVFDVTKNGDLRAY